MRYPNVSMKPVVVAFLLTTVGAFSQTYYWCDGSFNKEVFYPNVDGSGVATVPNWTDGTTVIDKAASAVAGSQYAFYVQNINMAEWNDTTENAADWHMYFSGSNNVLTMANMTKTSSGVLKIRTSTSSTGAALNVTNSMNLSAGDFILGANLNYNPMAGWAFNTANINTLNLSGTANATFAIASLMEVNTVNMNGGKVWIGTGTETSSGIAQLTLNIGNLNFGDISAESVLNDITIRSDFANIQNIKLGGTATSSIYNYVYSGILDISKMEVDNTFLAGGLLKIDSIDTITRMKVADFISSTDAAGGTVRIIDGILEFENAVHTGSGVSKGEYVFDLLFDGGGSVVLDNITVENYANIGYGKYDGSTSSGLQTTVGAVSLGNVNVNTGGNLWVVTDNLQFDSDDTINVSGNNSKMVIMNGSNGTTTSLAGDITVSDGGTLIIRRRSGSPVFNVSNVVLNASAADSESQSGFQVSSDSTHVVGGASIESLTFNPYAAETTGHSSMAYLFSSKQEVGSESMYVKNVLVNDYADGVIRIAQNTKIGSVVAKEYSFMTFGNHVSDQAFTVTIDGDYENSGQSLVVGTNITLNIKGDFINNSYRTMLYGLDSNISYSGTVFDVDGAFVNNGIVNLGGGLTEGKTANAYFGGIRSDYISGKQGTYRIHNTNGGTLNITLDGDGTYIYGNRIHTFSSSAAELGTSVINFNKTGSGVQYFASNYIYYRGTTTISNGEMYICANGLNNDLNYGLENIVLSGGKFGACGVLNSDGSVGAIGTVKAENFTWSSGAEVAVDFDADGNCDLILISGNFLKDASDAADAKYNFVFSGSAAADTEYKIFAWEDVSSVDFTEDDFTYSSSSDIEGSFSIRDNSLYFTTAIPEPSTYAAIFGIAALGFAALRRRRK